MKKRIYFKMSKKCTIRTPKKSIKYKKKDVIFMQFRIKTGSYCIFEAEIKDL